MNDWTLHANQLRTADNARLFRLLLLRVLAVSQDAGGVGPFSPTTKSSRRRRRERGGRRAAQDLALPRHPPETAPLRVVVDDDPGPLRPGADSARGGQVGRPGGVRTPRSTCPGRRARRRGVPQAGTVSHADVGPHTVDDQAISPDQKSTAPLESAEAPEPSPRDPAGRASPPSTLSSSGFPTHWSRLSRPHRRSGRLPSGGPRIA